MRIFPDDWKTAELVRIPKPDKKDMTLPSVCRPLCLLNTVCKLFEQVISHRINLHLDEKANLWQNQFGFGAGRSTVQAAKVLNDKAKSELTKGKGWGFCALVTVDTKNAFNTGLAIT